VNKKIPIRSSSHGKSKLSHQARQSVDKKEIVIKKIEPQKELKPDYIETLQYNIQEEQKVKEDTRSAEG